MAPTKEVGKDGSSRRGRTDYAHKEKMSENNSSKKKRNQVWK